MSEFAATIKNYESAIDRALKTASRADDEGLDVEVMEILIARQKIADELQDQSSKEARILVCLSEQDRRLKEAARLISGRIGREVLKGWREIVPRNTDAWWWSLDRLASSEKSWAELISTLLAWVLIAISLSFSLEIVRRYLAGGADFASTVLQGLIALVAGGAIFKGAREFVGGRTEANQPSILSSHKSRWVAISLMISLSAALVLTRKPIARLYNNQGEEAYENGRLTQAIDKYRHALSLDPTLAETHFNLANAYEDVLEYDKAISEYTEAILANQDFYRPYNNLARLYILRRNDYVGALRLIDKALTLKINPGETDPSVIEYALYKNRGWANLRLKNYRQAQADLVQALVKRRDGISSHCLLAQVLEAQQNKEGALEQWGLCSDLAEKQTKESAVNHRYDIDEPEDDWIETAKDRTKGK